MIIWRDNKINLTILVLLPVYILAHLFMIPEEIGHKAISDSGFLSIITMTLIACAFLTLATLIVNKRLSQVKLALMAAAYVLLIYLLREADFHRLFTLEHVTKAKFYTSLAIPLWQKIVVGVISTIFVISFVYLIIRYSSILWKGLCQSQTWAVALVLCILTLVLSQLCDKSSLNSFYAGRVVEECLECFASVFIFLASVQGIPLLITANTVNRETTGDN